MECIEARALKASFLSQMVSLSSKSNSQVYLNEDAWYFSGINEEFQVEELLNLDFSDDGGFSEENKDLNLNEKHGCNRNENRSSSATTVSGDEKVDSLSTEEFIDKAEGLESLEWLSQFAEDSSVELSLLCPVSAKDSGEKPPANTQAVIVDAAVPRKRRSERHRANGLRWPLGSPSSSVDSPSSSHGSFSLPVFAFPNPVCKPVWEPEKSPEPAQKRPKKKQENESGGRRCSHCLVQKTPQWRTGPLGPKTLCNACGVRFKSGRLFPEYRPACSPTFSEQVHSNSHRKVLEMRRPKEMATLDGISSPVVVGVSG